jgi:uncharacterized protein YkwD
MKQNFISAASVGFFLFLSLVSFSPAANSSLVNDVLTQTNDFRKSQGLSPLIMNPELNKIAQQHSEDMASGRVAFGHDGFGDRQTKASEDIQGMHAFAENVAYGVNTAKEVVTLWENSPGHRRNMLGNYKYIGIGIAKDSKGQFYYTEIFVG